MCVCVCVCVCVCEREREREREGGCVCVIKQVNSMMYEFIWNGKTNKVKRNLFEQEFKNGGYKMINFTDIITASSIMWVQKYLDNAEREWKYTLEYLVRRGL